ncbi:MAG: nucleotidyltransferase domain-containing protein [Clostridia bacterium]|nr:nucleotidyltransferase domain-containing protein [Clostridia bacterium]
MSEAERMVEKVVYKVADELKEVAGVDAIVFGGSRVIGTAAPDSNVDIGIYYIGDGVLDIEGLNNALTNLDDLHRQGLLAYPGAWGPWLNGGSCIKVDDLIVDISLRNITRVNEVIDACHSGNISIVNQFGHPFGFISSMYLAEVDMCKVLVDKMKNVANMKKKIRPFNAVYKQASINHFLWEADYSSKTGRRAIERKDVVYAAGALYKCANSLIQVVYSLNDEFVLNEKGSLQRASKFKKLPKEFVSNLETIFVALDRENIRNAFDIIDYYVNELRMMSGANVQ